MPVGDERLVVPPRSPLRKERIYLGDLAKYLHHNPGTLIRVAKRQGWLRKTGGSCILGNVRYVSEYAAQRLIAYIRALQGAMYHQGCNFHEHREYGARSRLRSKERRKAAARAAG